MRWITAGLITALMVAGCGGSSSSTPSPSSQAQVPTLQYTSGASVAIFANVSSQDAGDTACTTQQSQLIQQVKQIHASLQVKQAEPPIAGQVPTGVLVAFEYGSPTIPSQMLPAFLGGVAAGPPLTSAFTNMADTGDQYNHASVVVCVVDYLILSY